jgi:NAD(P)-dependent dehydrogenase (short-subunit alcohol dehydrogenase family)
MESTLILGATRGIGFALAGQLLAQGQHVTISGREQAGVDAALARLDSPHAAGLVADMRDFAAVRAALGRLQALDHLVLCGSSDVAWGPFASLQMDAVERALHMKLTGYLNAVQAALPRLAERGSITFVGGAASRAAMPGTVGLAAVNGALMAVTRTLAKELAPRRVNMVSPGLTDTEAYAGMPTEAKAALFQSAAAKLPVGRTGQPGEIAGAIAFALGNPYVTGALIDVDGGAHLG